MSARAVPAQQRAKDRYESILKAAESHYEAVGRDKFSMEAVAALAGCSVGSLYRYWPNRVSLIRTLAPLPEDLLSKVRDLLGSNLGDAEKLMEISRLLER